MPSTGADQRWSYGLQVIHWLMALMIIGMMIVGWIAASLSFSPLKVELFFWHKSVGILLLGLVIVRIVWRLFERRPAWPAAMPIWERWAARTAHTALYGLMIVTPLSGWVINSAAKIPFKVFGIWTLPSIVSPDEAIQTLAEQIHLGCFILFAAVLALHTAAAVRHHFFLKDNVLEGMTPVRLSSRIGKRTGTAT